MSITWWFFIGVLVVVAVLACWKFYRSRHRKRGPILSGRSAKMRVNSPPNLPPPTV
jgi:hypothetical protein